MTREEAINTLNVIKAMLKIYPKRKKQKEAVSEIDTALDMAIEALKGGDAEIETPQNYMQQSPSDGADLISREDVLKLIGTVHGDVKMETDERIKLYSEVCELPSADRPHGEWIRENIVLTSNPPQRQWHCSECGHILHGYDDSILTNYCPNCGERMKVR